MSIVKAYGADCCGVLKSVELIVGVSTAIDMFDNLQSYKTDMNADRCQVHYCLDCYRDQVLIPAENEAPRRIDTLAAHRQIQEYAHMFKKRVVANWASNKYFGKNLQKPR